MSGSDNSYLLFIFLPLMMMIIVISSNSNNDEYDLLTDEQKLEKQKQLALEQEEWRLQKEQDAKWWDENFISLIRERSPIVVLGGSLLIFITLIKTSNIRTYLIFDFRYSRWLYWLNVPTLIVIYCGLIFIAWALGYFDPLTVMEPSQ